MNFNVFQSQQSLMYHEQKCRCGFIGLATIPEETEMQLMQLVASLQLLCIIIHYCHMHYYTLLLHALLYIIVACIIIHYCYMHYYTLLLHALLYIIVACIIIHYCYMHYYTLLLHALLYIIVACIIMHLYHLFTTYYKGNIYQIMYFVYRIDHESLQSNSVLFACLLYHTQYCNDL